MTGLDQVTHLTSALADRYRVEGELGQGGMATVYRAHDLRHDRDVAIKVLHPELGAALGSERFLSEIRTTARLQHPHILPLLDSGDAGGLLYYVMPLVTGETLRARLDRERQLPIDDAVLIAREVADALGYAHGLGVIHRDIKPENILLQGGHALVSDFGIALAVESAGGARLTQTGLSLGTPQYMSPEQAMGERVIDARSDLYALGAVAYEMLVGEPPFTGPSVQAIVARIMTEEPRGLIVQRKAVTVQVEDAVLRALEKLPADRFSTAAEFSAAMTTIAHGTRGASGSRAAGRKQRSAPLRERLRDPLVLALAALTVTSTALAIRTWRSGPAGNDVVVSFSMPTEGMRGTNVLGYNTLAVTPDGRTLVYTGQGGNGRQELLVRAIDEITPRTLPGTENANNPVVSPDGKSVAFFRGNRVYRTPLSGGSIELLGQFAGTFNGATWTPGGEIIISGNIGLHLVPQSGGTFREFSRADTTRGERYQTAPLVTDDGRFLIYVSWRSNSRFDARIAIASMDGGPTTLLDVEGMYPLGVVDDVLVYVTAPGAVMGVRIDLAKRRVLGTPVRLMPEVAINSATGLARAALSPSGTLFYELGTQQSRVVLVGLDGGTRTLIETPGAFGFPRLSPSGTRLAITSEIGNRRDIWLHDLESGSPVRLTTEGNGERPEWSPDGTRVLYRTDQTAEATIWWRPIDFSAPATPLLGGKGLDVYEAVMSPVGNLIAYQLDTTSADIYYRATSGDTVPRVVANNQNASEMMPRISPDGRWIAFATDESGIDEVVVQPIPGPGGRVQVSIGGGSEPVWSRDGRRIFYRGGGQIMAATVRTASAFEVVRRDALMPDTYTKATNPHANFDVTPDGKDLVLLQPVSNGAMVVVSNWKSVLRARMTEAGKR